MKNTNIVKEPDFITKGSLVITTSGRSKRKSFSKSKGWKVTNIEYIIEILDKSNRFLSTLPGTIGNRSIEPAQIKSKSLGLFIGSIYLWNYSGDQRPEIYRVILMEKSVYLVKSECVLWASKPISSKEKPK